MQEEKILELKEIIIAQANNVEKMIRNVIKGFLDQNKTILHQVINEDEQQINKNEIKIDKLYTNILARYHTEAKELRTVLMIAKMNVDLERVGDHCVNIAESALYLIDKPLVKPLIDIPRMSELACKMLTDSINAFIKEDDELARDICKRDQEIDDLNEQIIRELITYMVSDSQTIERGFHLIRLANNIEKIADLSTNIAEEAVYMVKGKVIKHHKGIKK